MIQDISKSIEACAAHYGDDAEAVRQYLTQGQARALALPNRGPLRFSQDGGIHNDILDAYSEFGFYIFQGALSAEEVNDLETDLEALRENFPIHMDAALDAQGRTALGVGNKATELQWDKPLSDPLGGTLAANGSHPVKLVEPTPKPACPCAHPD